MAEKDTSTLLIFKENLRSGRMAQWSETALFSLEEVGVQVQIPAFLLPVFFLSSLFLPFGFLLFILTADPVIFARFLRKRISSKRYTNIIAIDFLSQYQSPNHGL